MVHRLIGLRTGHLQANPKAVGAPDRWDVRRCPQDVQRCWRYSRHSRLYRPHDSYAIDLESENVKQDQNIFEHSVALWGLVRHAVSVFRNQA